jgi:hypothetical protein
MTIVLLRSRSRSRTESVLLSCDIKIK